MWTDAHCHPTDTPASLAGIEAFGIKMICMSATLNDVELVASAATEHPDHVIPAFGLHPWYAHLVSVAPISSKSDHYSKVLRPAPSGEELALLPDPKPLQAHLIIIEAMLRRFPKAAVGEVGLDRAFRVRINGATSSMKTTLEHQRAVLAAQLDLAAENNRVVSLHGVQAHMPLFETVMSAAAGIKAVDLHAYAGSAELFLHQWLHLPVPAYVSMAVLINSRSARIENVLGQIPKDRILCESDFHSAGETQLQLIKESAEILANIHPEIDLMHNFDRFLSGERSS